MTSPVHSTRKTSPVEPQRQRRPQRSAAAALASLLGAAALAVSAAARAQTSSTATIKVTDKQILRNVGFRETGNKPYWISYSDCVRDDAWSFPLNVTNTSLTLEVWAGSDDCVETRPLQDRKQCWLVARITPDTDSFRMSVPVRNVVARITQSTDVPVDLPASVCDQSQDTAGESFTYYFMQVSSGQVVASAKWNNSATRDGTGFDMVGPRPPGGLSVGVGESQLDLRMSKISEEADRERFRAFCVPAGTAADDATDAGAILGTSVDGGSSGIVSGATDAGTEATEGTPSPAECANGVLFAGRRAPVDSQYECGEAAVISTSIRSDRLQNGVTYALAVAGEDSIGNTGKLSTIQCGTPTLLDDFFELYSGSGGPGGGGFCSFMPGASRTPLLPGLGLVAAAFGLALRRRRAR